ncbi:MAG: formylglycine-generating enzyme family protein, partial [Planctomycetota bacterium]
MFALLSSLISLASAQQIAAPALEWAEVLEAKPDAGVVADSELRAAIEATGLPWRVRDRASGIELLLVPPGKFLRGANGEDQDAESSEKPQREVTLSKAFYLGRREVTWAEWRSVMGIDPIVPQVDPQQPAWNMSCADIERFSARTGLRLPTETEWERACKAG